MKKLFKTFALIALTSFASFAHENDNKASTFEVGMYSLDNSHKVRLILEKEKNVSLTITLKNEKGQVIFKEYLSKKSTSYDKYFNLSELKNGTYTFEIDNGSEKVTKVVVTETETISNQSISVK